MPGMAPGSGPAPPPMPGFGPVPPPMMPGFVPGLNAAPQSLPLGLKPKKKWEVDAPLKRANWKAVNIYQIRLSFFF